LLYPECPKCPVFENGCIGWVIACKNNLLKWVEKEAEI